MLRFIRCLLAAFCVFGAGGLVAQPVKLEPVEATTGAESRWAEAVDGIETPGNGWVVPQATPQKGVFRCVPPMEAGRVRITLVFESGQKNSFFGEFSISATTDPHPSLASRWQVIFPVSFSADNEGWLERIYPHLHFLNHPDKTKVIVGGIVPYDHVTGIRLETWPSSLGLTGNAILTELRMERLPMGTSNIALGCPATANLPLPPNQYAEFLTDGLVGSFAFPEDSRPRPDFYFEIDLLRIRDLDHIALRGVGQAAAMKHVTHLHLQLFDEEPTVETVPVWVGRAGEIESGAEPGSAEVVRSTNGEGVFRGRYLRISSTNTIPYSPELAEVEVYESVVPSGVQVSANDRAVTGSKSVRVPAGMNWLSFALNQPSLRDGLKLGARWRIAGQGDDWRLANSQGIIETRGLPPGKYLFEAQLRHTDMEWNSATLRLPIIVLAPWWKNPWAELAAALALAGIAALVAWRIARRHVAELERRQELSRERARIARDMHDVVGARLTQLAIMQELCEEQNGVPPEVRNRLRQLSKTAKEAVASLDETVWAINPRNDTLQNVADYLCHTATAYLGPLEIECNQEVPDEWPELAVPSQKRHGLFLACKEALQNIAKHSGATEVTLTLKLEDHIFVVCLADNGRGLPASLEGVEKDGIENMSFRLAELGGACTVVPGTNGGTRVEMRLPL